MYLSCPAINHVLASFCSFPFPFEPEEEDDSSVLDREVGRRTAAVSSFFNTSFSTSKSETATKGRVEKGKENRMTLEGERNSALNQSSSSNNHNNKWRMKERASSKEAV